jgi:heme-degrading monooxygenase HmoA
MNCRSLVYVAAIVCSSAACAGAGQASDPHVGSPVAPPVAQESSVPRSTSNPHSQPLTIDLQANPNMEVRIDSFSVPAASRAEFEAKLHENIALLQKQPGFEGHTVFEKTSGPTTFNIVTVAVWRSPEAMKNAAEKVREHYRNTGFDMQATIARWGVSASVGSYHAPLSLQ